MSSVASGTFCSVKAVNEGSSRFAKVAVVVVVVVIVTILVVVVVATVAIVFVLASVARGCRALVFSVKRLRQQLSG